MFYYPAMFPNNSENILKRDDSFLINGLAYQ
jgi:hypothetical protein